MHTVHRAVADTRNAQIRNGARRHAQEMYASARKRARVSHLQLEHTRVCTKLTLNITINYRNTFLFSVDKNTRQKKMSRMWKKTEKAKYTIKKSREKIAERIEEKNLKMMKIV